LARRSALPAIANPAFPDEPSCEDDYVGEGDPVVDDPPLALGTPEELLVGVVPGIGSLGIHGILALSGAG